MFGYYLDLAWRSLRRSPGITGLMVLSIGVGVAIAMAAWTLVGVMSRDPIPQKSTMLYVPTIDAWGPAARGKANRNNEPADSLDYATAQGLLQDHRAKYQSAIYWIQPAILPARAGEHPFNASGFAVTGAFFPMLDATFKYGTGWSDADEAARAQVVVISQAFNDRLFGGGDSVGKTVSVNGREYRVVGVLGNWNPEPTYYDVTATGGYMLQPTDLFLPFSTAIAAQIQNTGSTDCFQSPEHPGFAGLLQSSCVWIAYMAQLDTPAAARHYQEYLEGFARERFDWSPNIRLRDLMAWLNYEQVVPPGFQILRYIGIGLLVVCLVDTIGLLLAKFLRRSGEIGIRRALGAPRRSIYGQFLTEAAVIGAAGGVLGIILTWLATLWLQAVFPRGWASIAPRMDARLLALTLVVAIVATLLAALYPVARAAHVAPALQIKSN